MEERATPRDAPPDGEVGRLAEHLFRREWGKLVAILTRYFGTGRIHLAEDVAQEALTRALKQWPYRGIPENPAAWLTMTAKMIAVDMLRRESTFQRKEGGILESNGGGITGWGDHDLPHFDGEVTDDQLRLIFVCAHPALPPESQAALALRTLCGFSVVEIARAFLTTEAAIAKRLTRARQRVRDLALPFEIPAGAELEGRLDGVLQTLYLLFNEGYKASDGPRLVREELCGEALRLATLLAGHRAGNQPRTHALLALMLLNAARFPARADGAGHLLRLRDQDRALWNRPMINRGIRHLGASASGGELSEYHLQAAIAAQHCLAPDEASTDWPRILALYDMWTAINSSPVIALNRAVALANVHGAGAGLKAATSLRRNKTMASYYLLHAVLGELERRLGHDGEAAEHYRRAVRLTTLQTERRFLEGELRELERAAAPVSRPRRGGHQARGLRGARSR